MSTHQHEQPETKRTKRPRGTWTQKEDDALRKAVEEIGARKWRQIAEFVPGRTHVQCLHRWQKVLDPSLVKGPWSIEEDNLVKELVAEHGEKKWSLISSFLPGRIGKQCRERWKNHLDPSLKKGDWESHEDELILKTQAAIGNKWAQIARLLPGRSDNAVKNRYYSTLTRKMRENSSKKERTKGKEKKHKVKNTVLHNRSPVSTVDAFPAVLPSPGYVPFSEYRILRSSLNEIEPPICPTKPENLNFVFKQETPVKQEVTIKQEPNYFPPVQDEPSDTLEMTPFPYFALDCFYEPLMSFPVHYYPDDTVDLFGEDYFSTPFQPTNQYQEPAPVPYPDVNSFEIADMSPSLHFFELDTTSQAY